MSEDIRRRLQKADRPRRPSPAEDSRIRERVFGEQTRVRNETELTQAELDDSVLAPVATVPPPRKWYRVFSAAAVLLAVGIGVATLSLNSQESSDNQTAARSVPAACAELPALALALDEWQTIETWAQLSETDPDLGEAVVEVLAKLDFHAGVDASLEALAQVSLRTEAGRNVVARQEAVAGGIRVVIDRLDQFDDPDSCDLRRLREALS